MSAETDVVPPESPGRPIWRGPVPPGASLVVQRGFYEGLEVAIDRDWVVIGRGRGADVVISEPTLSRAHAAFGFDGERFFVQDLGSTNGTLVNGGKERMAPLKDGDEVQIGKLLLRIALPTTSG
jgi:pSer/pThr/pTyr-binding forkhead associated (FHA) protein